MDYYEILGVARDASPADIERAFRSVARRVHPDLNWGDGNADARMKQLNHIRDTLADPLLRAAYDDRLRQEAAASVPSGGTARADGGRTESAAGSRFRASWTAPRGRWRAPGRQESRAAPAASERTPPANRAASDHPRRLVAIALVALPVAVVLATRWGSGPRGGTEPAVVTTPTPTPAPVTTPIPTPGFPVIQGDTPVSAPSAVAAGARRGTPADPESTSTAAVRHGRAGQRRGGVVRVGSTWDQVLGVFGRPDRIDSGGRPGDATMIYGDLRLDFRNGKLASGDVPGLQYGTPTPAARPTTR